MQTYNNYLLESIHTYLDIWYHAWLTSTRRRHTLSSMCSSGVRDILENVDWLGCVSVIIQESLSKIQRHFKDF